VTQNRANSSGPPAPAAAAAAEPTEAPVERRLTMASSRPDGKAAASGAEAGRPSADAVGLPRSKFGYLYKQGGRIKGWKRRWFLYEKGTLMYFKSVQVRHPAHHPAPAPPPGRRA